jgi:quercetin dioxygenase-like cupin family protein
MTTVTINDARRFSLHAIQRGELVATDDLKVSLLCFEAGQQADETVGGTTTLYQVLEGELLLRHGETSQRIGKGKLVTVPPGAAHRLENAGGGLLVVMITSPA